MFKMTVSAVAAIMTLGASAVADEPKESATNAAIEAAVFDYFDGQTERSAERLARAFSDQALMIWVRKNDDGVDAVNSVPIKEVLPRWAEGGPAGKPRIGKILHMDVVDDRIATVMFDSDGRFYDALTLAKVGDEWKIIGKAFVLQEE